MGINGTRFFGEFHAKKFIFNEIGKARRGDFQDVAAGCVPFGERALVVFIIDRAFVLGSGKGEAKHITLDDKRFQRCRFYHAGKVAVG
nr:hypothetical protein [Desulfoluna limicola]